MTVDLPFVNLDDLFHSLPPIMDPQGMEGPAMLDGEEAVHVQRILCIPPLSQLLIFSYLLGIVVISQSLMSLHSHSNGLARKKLIQIF